jgi:hypothetical protein
MSETNYTPEDVKIIDPYSLLGINLYINFIKERLL